MLHDEGKITACSDRDPTALKILLPTLHIVMTFDFLPIIEKTSQCGSLTFDRTVRGHAGPGRSCTQRGKVLAAQTSEESLSTAGAL